MELCFLRMSATRLHIYMMHGQLVVLQEHGTIDRHQAGLKCRRSRIGSRQSHYLTTQSWKGKKFWSGTTSALTYLWRWLENVSCTKSCSFFCRQTLHTFYNFWTFRFSSNQKGMEKNSRGQEKKLSRKAKQSCELLVPITAQILIQSGVHQCCLQHKSRFREMWFVSIECEEAACNASS